MLASQTRCHWKQKRNSQKKYYYIYITKHPFIISTTIEQPIGKKTDTKAKVNAITNLFRSSEGRRSLAAGARRFYCKVLKPWLSTSGSVAHPYNGRATAIRTRTAPLCTGPPLRAGASASRDLSVWMETARSSLWMYLVAEGVGLTCGGGFEKFPDDRKGVGMGFLFVGRPGVCLCCRVMGVLSCLMFFCRVKVSSVNCLFCVS